MVYSLPQITLERGWWGWARGVRDCWLLYRDLGGRKCTTMVTRCRNTPVSGQTEIDTSAGAAMLFRQFHEIKRRVTLIDAIREGAGNRQWVVVKEDSPQPASL
jgi:hypothetical protein